MVEAVQGMGQTVAITIGFKFPTGTGPVLGSLASMAATLTDIPELQWFVGGMSFAGGGTLGEALENGYAVTFGPGGITFQAIPKP
jgi:hypothetical protein